MGGFVFWGFFGIKGGFNLLNTDNNLYLKNGVREKEHIRVALNCFPNTHLQQLIEVASRVRSRHVCLARSFLIFLLALLLLLFFLSLSHIHHHLPAPLRSFSSLSHSSVCIFSKELWAHLSSLDDLKHRSCVLTHPTVQQPGAPTRTWCPEPSLCCSGSSSRWPAAVLCFPSSSLQFPNLASHPRLSLLPGSPHSDNGSSLVAIEDHCQEQEQRGWALLCGWVDLSSMDAGHAGQMIAK